MKKNKKRKNNNANEKGDKTELMPIIKGAILAFIITFIVFVAYALILTYTETTEKNIQITVIITTVISNFLGGLLCSIRLKSRGLLYGSICGLIYAIIMLSISFCVLPNISLGQKTIIASILAIASGGIGGIIGVNIKK